MQELYDKWLPEYEKTVKEHQVRHFGLGLLFGVSIKCASWTSGPDM